MSHSIPSLCVSVWREREKERERERLIIGIGLYNYGGWLIKSKVGRTSHAESQAGAGSADHKPKSFFLRISTCSGGVDTFVPLNFLSKNIRGPLMFLLKYPFGESQKCFQVLFV